MNITMRLPSEYKKYRDIFIAIALGMAGFLLNTLEFQLGWGLHFIFGNALVLTFARVLRPQWLMLAASISSLRSVFLWNHPWAWLIWTLEAGFIAHFSKKNASPVRIDVLYWLMIGAPLLVISYGIVMDMDRLSLLLVIVKQAANGVLNVVIGEIIYLAILSLRRPGRWDDWPKMPIESFLIALLLATSLIPTTAYLYMDAPAREQAVKTSVDETLQERLQITATTIGMWANSRASVLNIFAAERLAIGTATAVALPESLSREFTHVGVLSRDGSALWATKPSGLAKSDLQKLASEYVGRASSVRLAAVGTEGRTSHRQLVLLVPFDASGRPAVIIAPVREGALPQLLSDTAGKAVEGTFLTNPFAGFIALSQSDSAIFRNVQSMPESLRASALNSAILVSHAAYGNALMSDLRDAHLVRASLIADLPNWKIYSIASLAPEVLKARETQLELFTALCAFILLLTLFASLLSKRTGYALRQLAQSAADLAVLGTRREKIDSLVIAELNEISSKIASASTTVSRERGALISYQRRLDSIAEHTPIVVYALDVRDNQKGELIYTSEAIVKILGYSRDELAVSGWWSHAIHPEDYDRCIAIKSDLQPGKVINMEYRLRHKLGHYVWVYDSLSIESYENSDNFEAVGILADISERKAAAEQLLQADKMASLGRMISGTAHELNQPLNFIKMAASNLREHARRGQLDPDRFTAKLDSILSHVSRASTIILQMRIFGRMPKEAPFPIEVKTAVDAVLTMVAPQLELDYTRVETSQSALGLKVRALPVLLEQVLLNLILNANDAIRARHNAGDPTAGWIRVGIAKKGKWAVVNIEDNGTGISAEILPTIFEPFFTTKPPKEGTGLGLPISYGIIRDLGGTIRAENTENGARFVIELPLAE